MNELLHYLNHELVQKSTVGSTRFIHDTALFIKQTDATSILVYGFEKPRTPRRIATLLNRNTAAGIYSLFLVSGELLKPESEAGASFLSMLYNIYNYKIYACRLLDNEPFILPVYYNWQHDDYTVQFGLPVELAAFKCYRIERAVRGESVSWALAGFEVRQFKQQEFHRQRFSFHRNYSGRRHRARTTPVGPLARYYRELEIDPGAELEEIKAAYRRLARLYHPDTSPSPGAKTRMQAINDAYRHLTKLYK